jgi:hypothetical protein
MGGWGLNIVTRSFEMSKPAMTSASQITLPPVPPQRTRTGHEMDNVRPGTRKRQHLTCLSRLRIPGLFCARSLAQSETAFRSAVDRHSAVLEGHGFRTIVVM